MIWRRLLLTKKSSPLFVSSRPFKAGSSISGLRTRGASSGVILHTSVLPEATRNMDSPLVLRLLANGMSVAERAAVIVRDVMAKGELEIVEKTGANDLQTKADRAAHDCIINSIRAAFPGLTVIGEEGEEHISAPETLPADWIVRDLHPDGLKLKTPERLAGATLDQITVWVDPLDGTKEYTEGFLDHVTILIGIAVGREAVAGVINQPFYNFDKPGAPLGRTVAGLVGAGVVGLKRTMPPQDERIVTTTRSHGMGLIQDAIEACKATKVLRVGGAGHKVLLLIEGKAHAYVFPSPGCKKWDTCGPEAVLHAIGGRMTDVRGLDYNYDRTAEHPNEYGTLGTALAEQHKEYLDLIPQHVKDQVKDFYKKK